MIYLDNAATTSPKPMAVRRAVGDALLGYTANPGRSGHALSQKSAGAVFECRQNAASFFGLSKEENVIFTGNCTHALNQVLAGLLRVGDHVITSSLEHNAVMRPLNALAKLGISVEVAEVVLDDEDATLRAFQQLIKSNTKMIVCTHASNVLGVRLPIERLGQMCKSYGILLCVDAAQSAGVLPIDMESMNINYLCIAGHKGLYAPMGSGMLLVNGPCPEPLILGGTGTMSISYVQPDDMPERLESGTVSVPNIMGLNAGIKFVRSKGINFIFAHEMNLMKRLYDLLSKNKNIKFYTDRPNEAGYVPVLSFNVKDRSSVEIGDLLNQSGYAVRAGLHCAPSAHRMAGTLDQGTVRVCPSVATTKQEIEMFAGRVTRIAKD